MGMTALSAVPSGVGVQNSTGLRRGLGQAPPPECHGPAARLVRQPRLSGLSGPDGVPWPRWFPARFMRLGSPVAI